ncbi:hypothetical protein GQ43DRAFT_501385 [Delitschia confertaspora ATCC 74209]|uniref:Tetratricopeptide repeat protein n=1 Tax=Delitschia confertaspora ATCC 74209 TaxID=1513339 RepID=A0A9P4MWW0_9PLEO|nr:hypothetical protein GQ43DRAFT_501385 [Delitschia confertaspora ATCC 74209]
MHDNGDKKECTQREAPKHADPHGRPGVNIAEAGAVGRSRRAGSINDIDKTVLRKEHPNILTNMANMTFIYANQGRWKEAEELNMQVIKMFKRCSERSIQTR